jgi:hypothetical protein
MYCNVYVEGLTPIMVFQLAHQVLSRREFKLISPDQEKGTLTKGLASWLRYSLGLGRLLHSIINNVGKIRDCKVYYSIIFAF